MNIPSSLYLKPTPKTPQSTPAAKAAVVSDRPIDQSELSSLIGPEPPAPPASVYVSAAKGAVVGALAGAALGYGTHTLYSSGMGIPTAANLHFGGLLAGTGVGALVGQKLEPAFDPATRAVLGGVAGLTFTLCSSTLGAAGVVGAAAAYGAFMGAGMGFAAEMLRTGGKE